MSSSPVVDAPARAAGDALVSSLEKHASRFALAVSAAGAAAELPPEVAKCAELLRSKGHSEEHIRGFINNLSSTNTALESLVREVVDRCKSVLRGLSKSNNTKGPRTPASAAAQQARAATADKNEALVSAVVDQIRIAHGPPALDTLVERNGGVASLRSISVVKAWGQTHPVCSLMRTKVLPASTISAVQDHLTLRQVVVEKDKKKAVVPLALVTRSGDLSKHVTESGVYRTGGGGRLSRIVPGNGGRSLAADLGVDCVHVLFTDATGKSILCPSEFVGEFDMFGAEYVPRALLTLGADGSKTYCRALLSGAFPPKIAGVVDKTTTKRPKCDEEDDEPAGKRPKSDDETTDDGESD